MRVIYVNKRTDYSENIQCNEYHNIASFTFIYEEILIVSHPLEPKTKNIFYF